MKRDNNGNSFLGFKLIKIGIVKLVVDERFVGHSIHQRSKSRKNIIVRLISIAEGHSDGDIQPLKSYVDNRNSGNATVIGVAAGISAWGEAGLIIIG